MCVELESEELLGVSGDCPRHILPHSARRVLPQAKWLGLPIWLEMIWRATRGGHGQFLGKMPKKTLHPRWNPLSLHCLQISQPELL